MRAGVEGMVGPTYTATARQHSAQVVKHGLQAGLALLAAAQHPRLGQVDIAVAVADELPDFGKRHGELQTVHLALDDGGQGLKALAQRLVHLLLRAGGGHRAAEVLFDHRHRAAHQVAQVVGQIGVGAGEHGLVGVVAVRAEGHLAHQVIAQRVARRSAPRWGRDRPRCPWIWTSCRCRTAASRGRTPAWAAAAPGRGA